MNDEQFRRLMFQLRCIGVMLFLVFAELFLIYTRMGRGF